jgi:glycerol-3-phosphate dehydrogenase
VIPFDTDARTAALSHMASDQVDVLVVGGGITGCGVALDAASRGLSVALVEREDFAAGTSGRSSRLIHGGARYLELYDFGLVAESLRERSILLRLAPHLVRPMPMYFPVEALHHRAYRRLGLTVYDALAAGRNVHWHRGVDFEEMCRVAPGLGRPTRGFAYHECRTDDARLTVEVARMAAGFGALVANHAEVLGLLGSGRVRGASVCDRVSGSVFEVRARLVVNAGGVWAERIQAMAAGSPRRLRPSKGVHLVFAPGSVRVRAGMLIPSRAGDGRYLFVVPWAGRTYVGTTDTEFDGDPNDPRVDSNDHAYVMHAVTAAFPDVTDRDVVASWAGLRPLLDDEKGSTADLSRRHAIYEDPPGLLTVTGGKLTTFRAMAEDVVDRAVAVLGREAPCRTKRIGIGFHGSVDAAFERAEAAESSLGLAPGVGRRMVERYGDDWAEALRLIRERPELGDPATDGLPVLSVELELARTREMALTDEDVLARRTRLTTMDARGVRESHIVDLGR